ncbi:L-iditol 2-dehydrogenase [Haloechinothrix alba]|uniref:L-iditol 2-dehydrogenase n=1 Tax=Haloechinothrix alba TaxID=664784 RepID=A0A238VR10_9PSEU|nr:NAD(P)-dependent alcohol dehydrogenase [Haloechinothrix alba]SNR36223.1 L-iditol 2-dehydrogenase [Haloechinothrix alba]
MRAAVLRGVEDVEVVERDVRRPGSREVLVEVGSVGVCGSDVHYYEHGRVGNFVVTEPLVLGHEASGTVAALGSEVTGHRVGQRVSIEPGVPDFTCAECRSGRYNLCSAVRFMATPPVDGAFCEYVTVHEGFAHPVPETISDDEAALLEPLSVGVWACRKAGVGPGDRVLVSGAGPIGLVTAQAALAFGATEVLASDVNPHRLRLACELGCGDVIDVGTTAVRDTGFEPTVLLECSGNPGATTEAIRTVARAGRVVLVGMGAEEIPLSLSHVQEREIAVAGTFRYANTWPTAIALVASGRVNVAGLVSARFSLDEVESALNYGRRDDKAVKAIVRPSMDVLG